MFQLYRQRLEYMEHAVRCLSAAVKRKPDVRSAQTSDRAAAAAKELERSQDGEERPPQCRPVVVVSAPSPRARSVDPGSSLQTLVLLGSSLHTLLGIFISYR